MATSTRWCQILGTATSAISIPDAGTVSNVVARVRLNHNSDRDLHIELVGPDGTTATLTQTNGGDGSDFGSGTAGCSGAYLHHVRRCC